MGSDVELRLEEANEQYFWAVLLRVVWVSLVLIAVITVLAIVTVRLGWQRHVVLCVLGLVAGITVAASATGSANGRRMTGLVVGAITLPLLASSLARSAAAGEELLRVHTATLLPFLAHAAGAFIGAVATIAVWRGKPAAPVATGSRDEARTQGVGGLP